ncbi:MAG TPA: methyltransferase domain-containing protein [Candidatus Angelobacter sp.]|nr:methyltransferase domain-containing protein [Candidatus Angelobacter sp.]
MAADITTEITVREFDLQLWVATDLLRLRSLHYGYWGNGEPIKLDFRIIRQAQARYTKLLVDTVPPGVRTILDVGCGVGCNARALTQKGHKVTSISPDGNHEKFFQDAPEPLRFFQSKYENFSSNERYDLVLMSESQNYFDADAGLAQTRRLLTPGGYLLICGMFRKKNTREFDQVRNVEAEYLRKAQRHGFELIERVDITPNVTPTLDIVRMAKEEYITPLVSAAGNGKRWKFMIAGLLFRKELNQFRRIQRYYEEFSDSQFFSEHVSYLKLLFRCKEQGQRVN